MKNALVHALGAALLLATISSQAITIGFDPTAQDVTVGSALDVALVISGLGSGATPSLSTFDLDITFDGGILSFVGATFGDPTLGEQLDLAALGSLTSVTPGVGTVNLFELSFDSAADLNALQADSFTLATLTFSALSGGFSTLGITVNALGDANGDSLAADLSGGSVTSVGSAVPEPAPLLLVLTGLVGLAALRCATPSPQREEPAFTLPQCNASSLSSGASSTDQVLVAGCKASSGWRSASLLISAIMQYRGPRKSAQFTRC